MTKNGIKRNFERNLGRVRVLLNIYDESMAAAGRGRPGNALSDLLRACVVMLHAAFEDTCRSIAAERYPKASADVLNEIPFCGQRGRAKPISLGELSRHRGRTVDDLIEESVRSYLESFSVNNGPEIDAFLRNVGIAEPRDFHQELNFGVLCSAIKRRHHIVHQADKNPIRGRRGHHAAQPISRDLVAEWLGVIERFIIALIEEMWPIRAKI